jgi:hypothetical protein
VPIQFACTIPPSFSVGRGTAGTYKQDAHGLTKQFEPFLKAYRKGDPAGQEEAFKAFQFPDAKTWFGEHFNPDDVQQLVWDIEAEVDGERNSLATMMGIADRGGRFHARCKPYTAKESGTVKARQSAVHPSKKVPVEAFGIDLQAEGSGKRFSFLGNFVYAEGAYRYVGKGALPFWAMPDANDPAKKQ